MFHNLIFHAHHMQSMRTNIISFFDDGGRDLYTIGSFSIQAYIHILVFVTKVSREDHKSWSFDEPFIVSFNHSIIYLIV